MAKVSNVLPHSEINPKHTYLLLINPEEIPHMVLIHRSRYFALTYKGTTLGADFESYYRLLQQKQKRLLFLDLGIWNQDPNDIFSKYTKAGVDDVSCYNPIKEYLRPVSDANYAFELIPELIDAGQVLAITHRLLNDQLDTDNNFELQTYDRASIFTYIESLTERDAERKEDIPASH